VVVLMCASACGGDDDVAGDDDDDEHDSGGQGPVPDASPDATPPDAGSAQIPEQLPDELPTGPVAVTAVTYNVALLQTIKYNRERKPLIVEALRGLDADVLCLQEVWDEFSSPADMSALLSEQFPYAWWTWLGDKPFGNGVVILSRHPLYRGRALLYEANDETGFVDRVLLGADVVTDTSHFHVMCTHLEVRGSVIAGLEIQELAAFAEAEGYLDGPTFLLGDLNSGPRTEPCKEKDCTDDDYANYLALIETWDDPRADVEECSWCVDFSTPLQLIPPGGDVLRYDKRIDHCLTRALGATTLLASDTIFDEIITYEVDGEAVMTQMSDHRGVSCTFGVAK
jgi:endonuclease/exonuclease/phosphatase family metal-dependent hydrolase